MITVTKLFDETAVIMKLQLEDMSAEIKDWKFGNYESDVPLLIRNHDGQTGWALLFGKQRGLDPIESKSGRALAVKRVQASKEGNLKIDWSYGNERGYYGERYDESMVLASDEETGLIKLRGMTELRRKLAKRLATTAVSRMIARECILVPNTDIKSLTYGGPLFLIKQAEFHDDAPKIFSDIITRSLQE